MIRRIVLAGCFVAFYAGLAVPADPPTASWPQFRGPGGLGISSDRKPGPTDFGPGKNEIWKTALSPGLSSPCSWNDRIFITACDVPSRKLETICLSRRDGSVFWRQHVTVEILEDVHKTSSPATATPLCDGERVYVYFGSYGLIAYTMDGAKAWDLRLPVPSVRFGSGASPALLADNIVLNRMQTGGLFATRRASDGGQTTSATSEVLFVDRHTGNITRRSPTPLSGLGRSHASPIAVGEAAVVLGGGQMQAFDPKTGKIKWWASKLPPVATATPVIVGDKLFINCTGPAGDVHRTEAIPFDKALEQWDKNKDGKLQREEIPESFAVFTRLRDDHEGDFSLNQWFFPRADANKDGALDQQEWDRIFAEMADSWVAMVKPSISAIKLGADGDVGSSNTVWSVQRGVPEVPSLLVLDNRVYAIRNGGILTCLNADTGNLLYEERLGASGSYYASPISDGMSVYFVSQPGVVTVVRAGDKFERIARVDLKDDVSATPALVEGCLFIRTASHLHAFTVPR